MAHSDIHPLLVAAILSFAAGTLANWLGIRYAHQLGLYSIPSARRRHGKPVPLSGGLWIFTGFLVGATWLMIDNPEWADAQLASLWRLGMCMTSLIVLGYFDDRKILSVRVKFSVQLAVGALALTIPEIESFCEAFRPTFGLLIYPLVLIFIVGVTNAVNFIDGADGLLATVLLVSLLANGARANGLEQTSGFAYYLLAPMAGALLAFLIFNWRPARLFMGDAGSLLLGFTLVIVCLSMGPSNGQKNWHGEAREALSGILQLGYPIMDLLWVIAKRLRRGFSPFRADQNHLHHCLMRLGFSVPQTVLALAWLHLCLQVASFQVIDSSVQEAWPELVLAGSLALTYMTWIVVVDRWKTRELARMANPTGESPIQPTTLERLNDFSLIIHTSPLFEGHAFGNSDQAMNAIHSLSFLLESNCPKGTQVLWHEVEKSLHLTFPNHSVATKDVQGLQKRIQHLIDGWTEMFNVALSAPSLKVAAITNTHLLTIEQRRRLKVIKRSSSGNSVA